MSTPRLKKLSVRGYRSVDGWLHINFPANAPLVLIGENNAGKSNILRAVDFLFGDFWPGNHKPEDHEFFGREPEGNGITMLAAVDDLPCPKGCRDSYVTGFRWTYEPDGDPVSQYLCEASHCSHTFVSNQTRQGLTCMSVGVNRDLSYQLSYGSKWTTLSKLMRRFHDRLVADPDRVQTLKQIFDSLVTTFHEVEEFNSFGDALRKSFADFGGNLRYGLGVDFSAYDPSNYFRSLRVFPHVDGSPRTYDELGTGQEQILAMSFAYAYAQAFGGDGLILAIEEPESHLHPLAQQWLARKLREVAAAGVQVIVTTHSPYFVDLSRPSSLVLVRKENEDFGTTATQFSLKALASALVDLGAPADKTLPATIGPFYESAASYETLSGFYSRGCVLVEGQTESFALPTLLDRAGLDVLREGVAVVSVDGLSNMAKWVRLYRAFGIPVYPIMDTDRGKSKASETLAHAAQVLEALGCTEERQHSDDRLWAGPSYATFDADFESAMRATFGSRYNQLETEAHEVVGASKPLKARYCARALTDPEGDDKQWSELLELATQLRAFFGATDSGEAQFESPLETPSRALSRKAAPRRT